MTTTYCSAADVDFVLTEVGVDRATDDLEIGLSSTLQVTSAIEIAATEMNAHLTSMYFLADLSGNAWCKWTNAYLAAYRLMTRAANVAPPQLKDERDQRLELLKEIKNGNAWIPEQAASVNYAPAVTNFEPELRAARTKVRVVTETSTGGQLPTPLKRQKSLDEQYDAVDPVVYP